MLATRGGGPAAAPSSPEAATFLMLLVVAPILEEIVFRGGLQGWLERRRFGRQVVAAGVDVAVLLSSLVFALSHLQHESLAIAAWLLLPGAVLGRIKQVYGTLWAPIAMHGWYNGCLLATAAVLARA